MSENIAIRARPGEECVPGRRTNERAKLARASGQPQDPRPLRTICTKSGLSQKTPKLMVVPLVRAASKTWRKLNGTNQLPRVIEDVRFTDGVVADDGNLSRAA